MKILDDNGGGFDPELYSQIQHLTTGNVLIASTGWSPVSIMERCVPWSCPRCTRIYGPTVQICCVCNTKVAQKENP